MEKVNGPLAVRVRWSLPLSVRVILLPEANPVSVPPTVYVTGGGGGGADDPPLPHAVRRSEIERARIVDRLKNEGVTLLKADREIGKMAPLHESTHRL